MAAQEKLAYEKALREKRLQDTKSDFEKALKNAVEIDCEVGFQQVITHLKKLLPCDRFIVTGSYALYKLGLWSQNCRDLDIELYNPTEESLSVLKRLAEPQKEDYPEKENYYRIILQGQIIDIFTTTEPRKFIHLVDGTETGLYVSDPMIIVKKKLEYKSFKHMMQLKAIAEKFLPIREWDLFIFSETNKYQ